MSKFIVKVLEVQKITHDVLSIKLEKPNGYEYTAGQGAEIAINKENWDKETRPFTLTSIPSDSYLEFTIKAYPSHNGVTNELLNLKVDDEIILSKPWNSYSYKGEGVFIAGGTGITPFLSMLRQLKEDGKVGGNKLYFGNKTEEDIIHKDEFTSILNSNFINVLSDEDNTNYEKGYITKEFIEKHNINKATYFYICGPRPMTKSVVDALTELGVNPENIFN